MISICDILATLIRTSISPVVATSSSHIRQTIHKNSRKWKLFLYAVAEHIFHTERETEKIKLMTKLKEGHFYCFVIFTLNQYAENKNQ